MALKLIRAERQANGQSCLVLNRREYRRKPKGIR
jgi:hypothetical protein